MMTPTTSNTYLFGTTSPLDDLLRESYERIGIIGNDQTPLNIQSAIMSANLELSSWPGRGLNLWLIQRKMISLNANQPAYQLPSNTVRVLEVSAVQLFRMNDSYGVAFTTQGGNAANCFDPLQIAGCTQTAANGSIGWDYGAPTGPPGIGMLRATLLLVPARIRHGRPLRLLPGPWPPPCCPCWSWP